MVVSFIWAIVIAVITYSHIAFTIG
jgi:hypothetical protein